MSEVPETAEVGSGEEYGQSADTYSTPDNSWTAGLPVRDAEFAYAKGWENTIDLLRQYRDLEAIVGPDQVQMPGGDATPEEITAFWSRMGRPETPDGYNISPGESASGYDTMLSDWFRNAAHAVHMPVDMAESLHDRFREQAAEASAEYWQQDEQERKESEATLRQEWGRGFDARIEDAQRAVHRLGGDTLKQIFNETGLGDHPALIRAFSEMGRFLAGGGNTAPNAPATAAPSHTSGTTQAQREILRLRSDDKFMTAYGDRTHPSHNIAQEQMDELHSVAYPADTFRR
jgi:hypothetical protein